MWGKNTIRACKTTQKEKHWQYKSNNRIVNEAILVVNPQTWEEGGGGGGGTQLQFTAL